MNRITKDMVMAKIDMVNKIIEQKGKSLRIHGVYGGFNLELLDIEEHKKNGCIMRCLYHGSKTEIFYILDVAWELLVYTFRD